MFPNKRAYVKYDSAMESESPSLHGPQVKQETQHSLSQTILKPQSLFLEGIKFEQDVHSTIDQKHLQKPPSLFIKGIKVEQEVQPTLDQITQRPKEVCVKQEPDALFIEGLQVKRELWCKHGRPLQQLSWPSTPGSLRGMPSWKLSMLPRK